MKSGVITLGEALIDFIPLDKENSTFQKCPGGAPANVAVGLAKLQVPSKFVGKVGNDVLGHFLKETLASYQVDTTNMFYTDEARTNVVFVTLADDGERSFEFFIDPSADTLLAEEDIEESIFLDAKILHFGSISLISGSSNAATWKAVKLAKKNNMIVSYDPNLRLSLWDSEEQAKQTITSMLPYVDIVKISEEELFFITGSKSFEDGLEAITAYNIPIVVVTLGEKGSYILVNGERSHVPAMKVNAVDTTGAGDAFVSGLLYGLNTSDKPLSELSMGDLKRMAEFASLSGALAASVKGAMTALPRVEDVMKYLDGSKQI
ncbi:aminoimidazole riboside kinase [Alkalihalobacillus sp. MEB130]|uniref:aminoimidazole riboside kinase n=1 Tax=Alkalihalobacillus sp. MEB130 TaxID=2976704 RepID=UPI0028DD50D5|nr:aminoimidazole riboside kinase [Alkalihalobacillus sp. MEB130]MDT8860754.1 aminoimidazole riboside kinase [Alkalihalobacillus sp. MEB130]